MADNVLIVGNGGREHALGWSISKDNNFGEIIYTKGNAGTLLEKKSQNIDIDGKKKESFEILFGIVEDKKIDTIIVGPEQPLANGIVDFFYEKGFYNIFGPTKDAAKIESDKFYSAQLMTILDIPQARYFICDNIEKAKIAIKKMDKSVVIKTRGLAGGKGVYVCDNKKEAINKLDECIKLYGEEILVAERLYGREFSVFGISDGKKVVPLEISVQDHKRLLDNNEGPNTGGMGAYCPVPFADSEIITDIAKNIMTPVIKQMGKEGNEFKGFLYAGMIMTNNGYKVLEFNCRLGDPETQPLVMVLEDSIYTPILSALENRIDEINIKLKPGAACCIVMASKDYPYEDKIRFLVDGIYQAEQLYDVKVFHAGTELKNKHIITTGDRTLGITAYGDTIQEAKDKAYNAVDFINKATVKLNKREVFAYRRDIAIIH